mmetsp:Transcript_7597/g.22255  ORF Transcript_7597/g.22255 Transcript_7597/m.22255 type:complete len:259 (-) Transcript_7597:1954-2730(-)
MSLSGSNPVFLSKIVSPPHVMHRRGSGSAFSVIGKVGPTSEFSVLFVVQDCLLPLVVLRPVLRVEMFLKVFFGLLGVALHIVRIVHIQIVWIVFDDPLLETFVFLSGFGEEESMRGKCSCSTRGEWSVMPHQVRFSALVGLPVKVEVFVRHVDEFTGKTIKGRFDSSVVLLGTAAIVIVIVAVAVAVTIPVKTIEVGFDVRQSGLWAITDVVREFFQPGILLGFAAETPIAGWFVGPNKLHSIVELHQRCRTQGGESQ